MIVYVVMFVAVWLVSYGLIVFFKHKICDGYDYVCDLCKGFSLLINPSADVPPTL
jgi:hypothetical protein